ncbi:MAG: DUF2782 domain-containing protein [Pontibacterium sp.]
MKKLLLTALLLTLPIGAIAESLPPVDNNEPKITIRRVAQATYYEYSVNGELREIKVVPSVGKAYYLVPAEGDTFRRTDKSELLIPKWVLFSW